MVTLASEGRNAACDGVVDLLDSGYVRFHSSGEDLLAEVGLAATAFGDAATGTATAASMTDEDSCPAAGTIDHAHLCKSDGTVICDLTVTVTGGGGDIELSSLTVGAGDTLGLTSLTVTQPAS